MIKTIKHPLVSLICLLIMLSGVGALSGCGPSKATASLPAATVTPVATATPAVTTYASADGQYTLKYPTGWAVKVLSGPHTSSVVQFGSSSGDEQLVVNALTVQIAPNNYPALLKTALSNTASFQNAKVDTATTTASYPSGVWTVASATAALSGNAYVVRLFGIAHSGHTVIILTFTPSSSATTYYVPILTSFTFLK